ncbi:unnamed protein product [Gongylonema pulchrum]|uniref:ZP domain-containing protein n=1 Tax=Gongylonema pulchrum TaxID=637853 RepID=A0A183ELQ5_9BILA|nr:unnamed protein product [Gongylonema pulchrum]
MCDRSSSFINRVCPSAILGTGNKDTDYIFAFADKPESDDKHELEDDGYEVEKIVDIARVNGEIKFKARKKCMKSFDFWKADTYRGSMIVMPPAEFRKLEGATQLLYCR